MLRQETIIQYKLHTRNPYPYSCLEIFIFIYSLRGGIDHISINTFRYTLCCAPNVYMFVYILIGTPIVPLKQVLLRHCDYIASSLEVVGSGSNEPVFFGLNEPLAGLVRFYCKPSVNVLMLIKGMSVVFHQGFKQVLLKLCDFTESSLKIVGSGVE